MRALVRDDNPPRLDHRRPDPTPAQGEALVTVAAAAATPVDALVAAGRGPDPNFKGVLGHQFIGVVEDVTDERFQSLRGKRVVGAPDVVCGRCDLCKAGLRAHCRERKTIGILDRDGAFAEKIALPALNLTPVPTGVDDDAALCAPALAAAIQAVHQLHIQGKPYITVLGDTVVGLLTAQLMSRLNASVRVLGDSESRLARCESWGVQHRLASDVGRRADQDAVIDCTGSPEGFLLATRLVRPRGKVLVKSFAGAAARAAEPAPLAEALAIALEGELEILGSRLGPIADAMQSLASGDAEVEGLIDRRAPLDRAAEALQDLADRRADLIAIDI